MRHIKPVSQMPQLAATTPLESLILILFTVGFRDFQNYQQVIQSLQKYYGKTE